MTILIFSLAGYIIILFIDVINDEPVVSNTIIEATEIPIPGGIKEALTDQCDEYLIQPTFSSNSNYYEGYFINVQNLTYEKPELDIHSIIAVLVIAITNDTNYNATEIKLPVSFVVADSETSPFRNESYKLPVYVKDLATSSNYKMPNHQLATVSFTRSIRDTIIPNFKDDFGIKPTYYRQYYLMSSIQSVPIDFNTGDLFESGVLLVVQNHLIKKETEQRTRTFFRFFGLVGGAWGLAAVFYAALFGVDLIRPWGCVQFYCCGLRNSTYNKLKKTLPIIPLINSSESPPPSSGDVALQQRVEAIEVFLREYVVDVNYLENAKGHDENNLLPTNNNDGNTNVTAMEHK
ncbi:5934_t:CDS:2 [Funneliformis geosporum]|uniref:11514_t:CDS:1 n=1 Tax=Funneliformis geosporum TaxID=1117311 RepID=A0A9W4WIL6_9GLOM|nr:11514_t:CDS:2 [Funneliformis geosporum]CAI2175700.1 5934_t:CDS:2 [Funneliformis geosporum]